MNEEHITIPRRYFAKLEALHTYIRELETECLQLSGLQVAADKAAAEYEQDAMRYRWAIENIRTGSVGFGAFILCADDPKRMWDITIDEAMKS